eukprot:365944-Chlamydomonas_euryale.AAC.3
MYVYAPVIIETLDQGHSVSAPAPRTGPQPCLPAGHTMRSDSMTDACPGVFKFKTSRHPSTPPQHATPARHPSTPRPSPLHAPIFPERPPAYVQLGLALTAWAARRDQHGVGSTAWAAQRDQHGVGSTAWAARRGQHGVTSTA